MDDILSVVCSVIMGVERRPGREQRILVSSKEQISFRAETSYPCVRVRSIVASTKMFNISHAENRLVGNAFARGEGKG